MGPEESGPPEQERGTPAEEGGRTLDVARSPELAGTSWWLVEFQSSDDAIGVVRPADVSRYTIAFGGDGRVAMRIDCNRASATFDATVTGPEGGSLAIGPLALTRAACPDPALGDQLARHVEYFRTYLVRDGRLHVSLMADGGIYTWEPAGGDAALAREFDHAAVGALMVFDPTHAEMPGWRPLCGVALVHRRVVQTAGHCVQFLRAALAAGAAEAAWISFDPDPVRRFVADPADSDPASAGWHAIASIHDNPDNVDFVALRQSADTSATLAVWGAFHDTGAIVLARDVVGITPLTMANDVPGAVERLLTRSRCAMGGQACSLVEVGYGLQEFPPSRIPPDLRRRSALLRYEGVDSLFVKTSNEPPETGYGQSCPGDSGSPILLLGPAEPPSIVAISSSPADPFGVACTPGGLQYRVDTESHRRFIERILRSVEGR
jgi:para-nitrobenzyl esterase